MFAFYRFVYILLEQTSEELQDGLVEILTFVINDSVYMGNHCTKITHKYVSLLAYEQVTST